MTIIKEKKSAPMSPPDARQGALGKPVLIVLVSALIFAALGWIGVEFWGQHIDPDKSATFAPAPGPSTNSAAQPAGTASGGLTPQATTIDKSENNQMGIKSSPAQPSRIGDQN